MLRLGASAAALVYGAAFASAAGVASGHYDRRVINPSIWTRARNRDARYLVVCCGACVNLPCRFESVGRGAVGSPRSSSKIGGRFYVSCTAQVTPEMDELLKKVHGLGGGGGWVGGLLVASRVCTHTSAATHTGSATHTSTSTHMASAHAHALLYC